MIKTINTTNPILSLSNQSLIESAGLPYPLPNGTSISCKVIADGVNNLNDPETIESETPVVRVVADSDPGGDPDALFLDDSLAVSLDWITENGTATVQIDNGVYDDIEWEVTETAQADNPRSGNFPNEIGVNRGIATNWETWSTFKNEVDSGVTDFGGRAFYTDVDDRNYYELPSGVTIKNAQFSGGPRLNWSYDDASGYWVADLPLEGVPGDRDDMSRVTHSALDPLCIPRLQKNVPFQACWPINTNDDVWPWDIGLWTESSDGFWISGAKGNANNPSDVMICRDDFANPILDGNGNQITRPRHTVDNYRATNIETRSCDVLTEVFCSDGPGTCACDDPNRGEATSSQYQSGSLSILDYNLYKGEIRGLKFTEASIGASRLAELDAIFSRNDASNIHIIINSDANVTADYKCSVWLTAGETDPTGRTLGTGERFLGVPGTLDGAGQAGSYNWNGYMHFILTGDKEFIQGRANKFAVEYNGAGNRGKIYYNPPNDDWLDDSSTPEALYPVSTTLFYGDDNVSWENCVFHTQGQFTKSPGFIIPDGDVTLKNSLFFGCTMIGRSGRWNSESNYFWYPNFSGFRGVAHGSQFKNNNFYGLPRQSAIYASGTVGDPREDGKVYPVPMQESIFEGNFFDITFSNHGQGISLYFNAWGDATVKNNIFLNCGTAMSYQPASDLLSDRNPWTGKMVFENNLVIYQQNFGKGLGGGQSTWAFNGKSDAHMPPVVDEETNYQIFNHDQVNSQNMQQVRYWNNTCLVDFNHPSWSDGVLPEQDIADLATAYRISKAKHRNSQVVFANNLVVGAEIVGNSAQTGFDPPISQFPPNKGHVHFNNLVTRTDEDEVRGISKSYGYYDARFSNEQDERLSQAYDFEDNVVINSATTGGRDGGKIGVRWESYPTKDELKNIPINWADIYVGNETIDRWGGTSQADYENQLTTFIDAGDRNPLTFSGGDQRPYANTPTLVQQVLIERVDGNEVATTNFDVTTEEVFQFAQGGNADNVFTTNGANDVTVCWFWHGNHATGDDINGNPWGATTTPTNDRVSFPSDGRRLEYYDAYEIRFVYTSADGTVQNGIEGEEYSFRVSPDGDQEYGVPVGEISVDGQPAYLKISPSQSDQVRSANGIPSWGTVGDKIEYFIYRLDPA